MKALRTLNQYPPGSLMNPAFRYRPSGETDVARTFARIRRAQAMQAHPAQLQLALCAVKKAGA